MELGQCRVFKGRHHVVVLVCTPAAPPPTLITPHPDPCPLAPTAAPAPLPHLPPTLTLTPAHSVLPQHPQVSGEAGYTDDIKLTADAVVGVLVTSAKPHARLVRVDASKALEVRLMVPPPPVMVVWLT